MWYDDAGDVVGIVGICVILICVEFVLENWHHKEHYLVLERVVGKKYMTNDSIADMITMIRNASMVRKGYVVMDYTKMRESIAGILKAEGYIVGFEKTTHMKGKKKQSEFPALRLELKYDPTGVAAISNLKRISKPGRRVFTGKDDISHVLNGIGVSIISTSKGLMTNRNARKAGIGGEVLFEIY